MDMYEWEILSHLHPKNNIQVDDLDILGHRDIDTKHNWAHSQIPLHLQEYVISFIDVNRSSNQIPTPPCSTSFLLSAYLQLNALPLILLCPTIDNTQTPTH